MLPDSEARVLRASEGEDGVVVCKEIGFGDGEFEVEDVEELTLDAADVTLAEDASAECPVDILECGVIQVLRRGTRKESGYESMTSMVSTYLVGEDECAEEDALVGPLLEGDLDVWLGTLDVYEGDEEGRNLDLCLVEDVCDELEELGVFRMPGH